jgi:phospholipase C
MDYTAVLKLVEQRFGLPNLNQRDAAQPEMLEFFDFLASPNLHPPPPALQPTTLPCSPDTASAP